MAPRAVRRRLRLRQAAGDRSRPRFPAARRGELPSWLRELQGLLPAAAEADYRTADGGWDGEGLASDLRVAKGRAGFARLVRASRRKRGGGGGGGSGAHVSLGDYLHGGDRWDLDALEDDLALMEAEEGAAAAAAAEAEAEEAAAAAAAARRRTTTSTRRRFTFAARSTASPTRWW